MLFFFFEDFSFSFWLLFVVIVDVVAVFLIISEFEEIFDLEFLSLELESIDLSRSIDF